MKINHQQVKRMPNSLQQESHLEKPLWLSNFINVYQTLSSENLVLLETIYHREITFIDPIHQVEGFDELYYYFENLYQNLSSCEFIIQDVMWQHSKASIYWKMTYVHPKLNKGRKVTVFGSSYIKGENDKVIYHRDYLDLGAMLYEQLPLFGRLIKWLKAKAGK
ncbi:nuclear transport factor 2 family protein [Colwelliaceae bacterium 6441]